MSKAAIGVRRSLGLDSSLRHHLTQSSLLVRPPDASSSAAVKAPALQKPKSCLALGLCVCTKHPDAGFLFANMVLYFRNTCWKKKKENKASGPRILVESSLLVLELKQQFSCISQASGAAGRDDDWDNFYQEHCDEIVQLQERRVFLHLGRVDFQSWHFGALHLALANPPVSPYDPEVTFLVPACDDVTDHQLGVYSDVQAFVSLLDLGSPCTLKLHSISLDEDDWLGAPPQSIAIRTVSWHPFIR